MEYRYFGRTGLKISAACMGGMTFGREIGEEDSHAILDAFAGGGGRFIDTADNIYSDGASEEIIGRWLKKQADRSDWVLATKVGFPTGDAPTDAGLTRKHIFDAIDASLRRLQTDYVDLYQVHWWDNGTPIEETLAALDTLVRVGKVRYLGCSNFTGWQLMLALSVSDSNGWARFESLQPMYSLLVREPDLELLPVCRREGLAIMPYSPLSRGALTGKHKPEAISVSSSSAGLGRLSDSEWQTLQSACAAERKQRVIDVVQQIAESKRRSPAQVALAWVSAQGGVAAPILGARTLDQLKDNLGFLDVVLSDEEIGRLDAVSRLPAPYPHDYIQWANGEYKRNR